MPAVLKDYAELEAYSKAQTKTIVETSKRLKEKDEEIKHLKKLLEGSVPLIKDKKDSVLQSNDQEYICRTEISKLRDLSNERDLTLEECKKFDIYSKILKELSSAPKVIEVTAKTLTTEQLTAVLMSQDEDDKSS